MPAADVLPDTLKPLTRRHAIALSAERYSQELDEFVDAIERGLIQDYVARQDFSPGQLDGGAPATVGPEPAMTAAGATGVTETGLATVPARVRLSSQPPPWQLAGVQSKPSAADDPAGGQRTRPDAVNLPGGQ